MTTAKTEPSIPKPPGGDLFIVDNSDSDWKVRRYLHDWCDLSRAIDIATGYFEIGSLLCLDGEWQKVDALRLLMCDEAALHHHGICVRRHTSGVSARIARRIGT